MISAEKMQDFLRKSICRFIKTYNVPAERIQIIFSLDEKKEVRYFTSVDNALKNTVHLSDLIGKNIYNPVVSSHIKKLLVKFAQQNQMEPAQVNMMAGIKAGDHVYVWLRKLSEMIRPIEIDELVK